MLIDGKEWRLVPQWAADLLLPGQWRGVNGGSTMRLEVSHDADTWARLMEELAAAPQPPAATASSDLIEHIAGQWDGCTYDAPGGAIDIGAAIRAAAGNRVPAPQPQSSGSAETFSDAQYIREIAKNYSDSSINDFRMHHDRLLGIADRLDSASPQPPAATAAPSDEEIYALAEKSFPRDAFRLQISLNSFARALLSRYGQAPAASAEPVAWAVTNEAIGFWTACRTQDAADEIAAQHTEAGYKGAVVTPLYAAPVADQPAAKEQYEQYTRDGAEPDTPLERLRFFCSLAMSGQDWLDVEPYFDALVAQQPVSGAAQARPIAYWNQEEGTSSEAFSPSPGNGWDTPVCAHPPSAPQPVSGADGLPVPYPNPDDVTPAMRAGFERLFHEANKRYHATLARNEHGAYRDLRVAADWQFYQRAWADALAAQPQGDDALAAVRWAPSSAYWSQRLVEIFGPDAREGINVLEARLRDAQADANRWRYISRKLCLTGNGDGTCAMHAINLPASIPGWPEPGEVAEFCGAAIDAAMLRTTGSE